MDVETEADPQVERLLDHIIVGGVSVSLAAYSDIACAQVIAIYSLIQQSRHERRRILRRCVNFHCLALSTLV